MVVKFKSSFFLVVLLFFLTTQVFAQFEPKFVAPSSFPKGELNFSFTSSSGAQIDLSINGEFIETFSLVDTPEPILLSPTSGFSGSYEVGRSAQVEFCNEDSTQILKLNFTSQGINRVLTPESCYTLEFEELGNFQVKETEFGSQATIRVVDKDIQASTIISQQKLLDGQNTYGAVLKDFEGTVLDERSGTFSYVKFPNSFSLSKIENVSLEGNLGLIEKNSSSQFMSSQEVSITGKTLDPSQEVFYLLNYDGVLGNLGSLIPVETDEFGNFEFELENYLNEGENFIRLISSEPGRADLITAEKYVYFSIDTLAPEIDIISMSYELPREGERNYSESFEEDIFVPSSVVSFVIETEAENFEVNNSGDVESYAVVNDTVEFDLRLEDGQNNVTFIATDRAGNFKKQAHAMFYSDSPVELLEISPENGDTVHFFIQSFEGKVSSPHAEVTMFSIRKGQEYVYREEGASYSDSQTRTASCEDYKYMLYSEEEISDNDRANELGIQPYEVQLSLTDIIQDRVTVTADGSGKFTFDEFDSITLKSKELDSDSYETNSNEVEEVSSPNEVCILMKDKYGNRVVDSVDIELDSGNTMWTPGAITTTPSTVYSAEIERVGSVVQGDGNARFTVIAEFTYQGGGQLKSVSGLSVRGDTDVRGDTEKFSQRLDIISSELYYVAKKDENVLLVYFPVEIKPAGIDPLEYPSSIDLNFEMSFNYVLEESEIPIDTTNPVYFQSEINVENPLDHTKWLSPETIDSALEFLNDTIEFTQKAKEITGYASVGGVLACTGYKLFYYPTCTASAKAIQDNEEEKQQKLNECKEQMYYVCDRVYCSAAPQECSNLGFDAGSENSGLLSLTQKSGNYYSDEQLGELSITSVQDSGKKLADFDRVVTSGACDYDGDGNKNDGVYISADVTNYKKSSGSWYMSETKSQEKIIKQCVQAKVYNTENKEDMEKCLNNPSAPGCDVKADMTSMGSACYSEGAPKFDNTRTMGSPGINPKDNIIESIQAACITDTYSHLSKYLQVQEGIQRCLQEAKLGISSGSYCERLMSIAVCDVATNVLFKTIGERSVRGNTQDGSEPHDLLDSVGGYFALAQEADADLNDRYEDSNFYTANGFSTEQIGNKVCLASLTGDWDAFMTDVLGNLDKNQVDPIFGPAFGESRVQGVNPFNGHLSVRYAFTYAVVSGGQAIRTKAELVCDKSKPGSDWCPDGVTPSDFSRTLSVSASQSVQDTIIITDDNTRYMYNVLRLTHTYELNGETITKVQEEEIFAKENGDLINCHWDGGLAGTNGAGGIVCDAMFAGQDAFALYSIDKKNTKLVPESTRVYYPGNPVLVDLSYDVRDPINPSAFDLAYMAKCRGQDGSDAVMINYQSVPSTGIISTQPIKLFEIPSVLGNQNSEVEKEVVFEINLGSDIRESLDYGDNLELKEFKFKNLNSADSGEIQFKVDSISGVTGASGISSLKEKNFIISSEKKGKSEGSFEFELGSTQIIGSVIRLKISGLNVDGVSLTLKYLDGFGDEQTLTNQVPSKIISSVESLKEFENLQPGPCELSLLALPSGEGQTIINLNSIEDFNNYTPSSQSNVGTSSNLQDNSRTTLNFVIGETILDDKKQQLSFSFIEPSSQDVLCVKPFGDLGNLLEKELKYIALASENYLQVKGDIEVTSPQYNFRYISSTIDLELNEVYLLPSLGAPETPFSFSSVEEGERIPVQISYTLTSDSIERDIVGQHSFTIKVSDYCDQEVAERVAPSVGSDDDNSSDKNGGNRGDL